MFGPNQPHSDETMCRMLCGKHNVWHIAGNPLAKYQILSLYQLGGDSSILLCVDLNYPTTEKIKMFARINKGANGTGRTLRRVASVLMVCAILTVSFWTGARPSNAAEDTIK